MRMSADLRNLFLYEVFLYYNPLLIVVSFSIFLTSFLLIPDKDFYSNLSVVLFFFVADLDGLALGS